MNAPRSLRPFEGLEAPFQDGKTEAIAVIIRERVSASMRKLLVVGCGAGVEAAILAQELGTEVVGVDPRGSFNPAAAATVELRCGDATCLDFAAGAFDFVFSYHALEHIPAYRTALAEMRRVLSPGGGYCVGTPNRHRLVGYLGSKNATLYQKIRWNTCDWNARLHGQFTNECGAHAGFSASELKAALQEAFGRAEDITLAYYERVYERHANLVGLLGKSGLSRFVLPSIYFIGSAQA